MPEYLTFKESNCKNCYRCIRRCPVKAIGFSGDQAHVVAEECILCGECFVNCPQNAKSVRTDLDQARHLIKSGDMVYISVAPSYIAAMPGISFNGLRTALKKLGFADAEETAIGAAIVKKQYEDMIREEDRRVILSTCCHSVNMLVQKYFPDLTSCLAPVVSPMLAHALNIRKRHPQAKIVFAGPCISKKEEAEMYAGYVDCVLTFEELFQWFKEEQIVPEKGDLAADISGRTRLFPTTGGILDSMDITNSKYSTMAVDGVDNCMMVLSDIANGNLDYCFIEMSACRGSCIGGPAFGKDHSPVRSRIAVQRSAGSEDFAVEHPQKQELEKTISFSPVRRFKPGSGAVEKMLEKMGKSLPEHELNCGFCGYDTCREKAAAIITGKAEISMCLPYLMARAESFSDHIINNTPNGVVVLNRDLEVQQINTAACRLMNIREEKSVIGRHVVCILDPAPFEEVIAKNQNIGEKKFYLAEYEEYVMMAILYDANYDIIIAIMRDITAEQNVRETRDRVNRNTIEIADKVIAKQMRTVQEIASLLGETTAETKVALEKLKETLHK